MDRLDHIVAILASAADGVLDDLECPDCHARSVSVRFTNPQEGVFRTWLVCSQCTFEQRSQNSEKPRTFSSKRVDKRLQDYDAAMLEKAKFPFKM